MSLISKVILSGILFASIFALASPSEKKPRADLNIWEITSLEEGDFVYRAIKGSDEIYPFLVIEKIRIAPTEGDKTVLLESWPLKDIDGGSILKNKAEGDEIRDIKWRHQSLEFKYASASGNKDCKVQKIVEGKPKLVCRNGK